MASHMDLPADITTPAKLELNVEFNSDISDRNDVDWIRFDVVEGYTYSIVSNRHIGTLVRFDDVHDQLGNLTRLRLEQYGSENGDAIIMFTARESTHYFLTMRGTPYSSNRFGPYFLRQQIVDDFRGDVDTQAGILAPEFRFANIKSIDDQDWFRMSLNESSVYEIQVKGLDSNDGTLADPFLQILDEDGSVISSQVSFNDNGGVGRNARLKFNVPFTGSPSLFGTKRYYVAVSGAESSTGTYRLSINQVDDFAATVNTTAVLTPLTKGVSTRTGYFHTETDTDWFRVPLIKNNWYKFSLAQNDSALLLRSNSGELLAFDRGNSDPQLDAKFPELYFRALDSGDYFLVAREGEKRYKVTVEQGLAPHLQPTQKRFLLENDQRMRLDKMFTNQYSTAVRYQVKSPFPIFFKGHYFRPNLNYVFKTNEIQDVEIAANVQRGNYRLLIRSDTGGPNREFSAWQPLNVYSTDNRSQLLDSGQTWGTNAKGKRLLTISFSSQLPDYFEANAFADVEAVSPGTKKVISHRFRRFQYLSGLQLKFVADDSQADIRIFAADLGDSDYQVFAPGQNAGGDIVINSNSPLPATYEWAIGQSLGLNSNVTELSIDESMMSSDAAGQVNVGPQRTDIQFLRRLYGKNLILPGTKYNLDRNLSVDQIVADDIGNSKYLNARDSGGSFINLQEGKYSWAQNGNRRLLIQPDTAIRGALGSIFNDVFIGNAFDNVFYGAYSDRNNGEDVFNGKGGNDRMFGGLGKDTYIYEVASGNDRIIDRTTGPDDNVVDTLIIRGNFGLNDITDDLMFRRGGEPEDLIYSQGHRTLKINLNLNGNDTISHGLISAINLDSLILQDSSGNQLGEKIDLRSVFTNSTSAYQRMIPTSILSRFGSLVVPV